MYYNPVREAINDTIEDFTWALRLFHMLVLLAFLITKLKVLAYVCLVTSIFLLYLVIYEIIVDVQGR